MNTKEELLKFVSEVNDGIIFIDQKGEFTFFNEGWLELIQYSKVELENKKIVDFIHPLDQEQFNELIKSLLINEELDLFVLRVVTKHKAVRFVQFYVKGVYEGDNYIGARFIASDVTIREFSRRYFSNVFSGSRCAQNSFSLSALSSSGSAREWPRKR